MTRMSRSQPSIFLSHSSADNTFAKRLGTALAQNGVRVWIDEAEIRVGDGLLQKITEGITGMEYLGVILSPKSVKSRWVQKELHIAMIEEIEDRRIKVLPIYYRGCTIPAFLRDKVYADFRNPRLFQHSLVKLLDRLLPKGFTRGILSVVENSIQAEFSAYKHLSKRSIQNLDRFFTIDGSARKRVVHLVRRHQQRGWVLDNQDNPSTAELLSIRLGKVTDGRAEVHTEEYWYLRWYDSKDCKYDFIYNKRTKQRYILLRDSDGNWKVDVNIYPGFSGGEYLGD